MRRFLVEQLLKKADEDTYFLTADVGYGLLEPLQDKLKDRFINVGIAEQSLISIASGIALSGKKVYTYTMGAFYLRALEQIKLDICYQDVPVIMLGLGPGFDYGDHGTTHLGIEDDLVISSLKNIDVITPKNKKELKGVLDEERTKPLYLRVSRFDELRTIDSFDKVYKYPKEYGDLDYFNKKYS